MCSDHFGVSVVTSCCRIMWKIIIKIYEEAHKYFTEIVYMDVNTLLLVSSITSAFHLYKQEQLSFVVESHSERLGGN